ncbi:MAG: hypothetical protein Q9165_000198 [Trypethelium subeluteriae]
MEGKRTDYSAWTHSQLRERIAELEGKLEEGNSQSLASTTAPTNLPTLPIAPYASHPKRGESSPPRVFDPSKYATRLIALKFAYLGQRYNGLEHHVNNKTPLTTIEEELWKALMKTKLIFPTTKDGTLITSADAEMSWLGCEYSKCGRTDKGVSAFGQVVGLRVRSSEPLHQRVPNHPTYTSDTQHPPTRKRSLDPDSPPADPPPPTRTVKLAGKVVEMEDIAMGDARPTNDPPRVKKPQTTRHNFSQTKSELPYVEMLNRVLPSDIRILAWCPTPPPNFSARFSCKERRYRYFFTQPAFMPTPGALGLSPPTTTTAASSSSASGGGGNPPRRRREGWLDIDAMREAAGYFVGLHDFRNFCKMDPSKQLAHFKRRVFRAEIEALRGRRAPVGFVGLPAFRAEAEGWEDNGAMGGLEGGGLDTEEKVAGESEPSEPVVYSFNVDGSGFLWHQVRCMTAVLFLVGQGLEKPDVVKEMLDVEKMPAKPIYELADDKPLVLWDCIFPAEGSESREDALEWIYAGDTPRPRESTKRDAWDSKKGPRGVMEDLWQSWRNVKIDEVLAGTMIGLVATQGHKVSDAAGQQHAGSKRARVFTGGNMAKPVNPYLPILARPRLESYEGLTARYAARKGLSKVNVAVAEDEANE